MFDIETTIPMPTITGRGRDAIYPFAAMAVGDSFIVPKPLAEKARSAAVKWKARHSGWAYAARVSDDGSIRIWRTA